VNYQLSIINHKQTLHSIRLSFSELRRCEGFVSTAKTTYYKGIVLAFSHFFHIFAK